jgi:hypothetical protein
MKNATKQKIKLLRMIHESPPRSEILACKDDPDWSILMEWHKSEIINCTCCLGEQGDLFMGASLTQRGISLLASLEEQTSIGQIKNNRFRFYKWFGSSLGGAVIGYIARMLTE